VFWLLAALDLALFSFGSGRLAQAGGVGPFRLLDKNRCAFDYGVHGADVRF